MRRRWSRAQSGPARSEDEVPALIAALEARGVEPGFAATVVEQLIEVRALRGAGRDAVLEGVVAAFRAHRRDFEAFEQSAENIDEIQRLMSGFAEELRKLEEGLRIVSAYVLRMYDKASGEGSRRLH